MRKLIDTITIITQAIRRLPLAVKVTALVVVVAAGLLLYHFITEEVHCPSWPQCGSGSGSGSAPGSGSAYIQSPKPIR